ncbi:MAG TPA: glycerophosphodiester phosphodiesterase [Chitinophagales bacterium]|nr:glycerophosphodiester phosphodiesterase [Chitinophagales bacterium]
MFKFRLIIALFIFVGLNSCKNDHPELPIEKNPFLVEKGQRPLVIAHRGGTYYFPENTMLAFGYSKEIGADVLELDIHLSADGKLVVCHDDTVDRTSDQSGPINKYTYAELATYNFGYQFKGPNGDYPYRSNPVKIPLLEEVFQSFSDKLMIVEIKSQGELGKQCVPELLRLIEKYNMQKKVSVFSFEKNVIDHFVSLNKIDAYTGGSANDILDFIVNAANGTSDKLIIKYDMLVTPTTVSDFNLNLDHPSIINTAKNKKVSLCYWTVNDEPLMRRLIESGADGIITDRAELLQVVLEDMGF